MEITLGWCKTTATNKMFGKFGAKKAEHTVELVKYIDDDYEIDPLSFTNETHWAIYQESLDTCVVISKSLPYMKVVYHHTTKTAERYTSPMTTKPVPYFEVTTKSDTWNKNMLVVLDDHPFPAPSCIKT
jgi:hypothetical protein